MKRNKGFTLIELLGVITLLGVIALVVFPLLLKQINNARSGIKDANDVLLIDAAKDYVSSHENQYIAEEGNNYCISMETLINENYFNPKLKDSENKELDLNRVIEISYKKNKFNYKIVENKKCQNITNVELTDYPQVEDNNPGIICGDGFEDEYATTEVCYIKSIEDLIAFSTMVNNSKNFENKTVILENNISFKSTSSYATVDQVEVQNMIDQNTKGNGFTPIGISSNLAFKGTFDGNDKQIGNIFVSNTTQNYEGLFGYLNNATIKDLNLDTPIIRGNNNIGTLVGYANNTNITNINVSKGYVYGNENIGGIIGNNYGNLTSSTFNGEIDGNKNIGLAVGYNYKKAENLIVKGNVTGSSNVGGIVGYTNANPGSVKGIILEGKIKSINGTSYRTLGNGTCNSCMTIATENVITNGVIPTANLGITNSNGYSVNSNLLRDINSYERVMDTYIGGDNDNDGYYYDYDENENIVLVKTEDKPIEFTLEGEGTEDNPYKIKTPQELAQVSQKPSSNYILIANIDYQDAIFYMLSSPQNNFTGTFDGNSYTISNINAKGSKELGLFGQSSGTIKNITLDQTNFNSMATTGILVGENNGYIENINVRNSEAKAEEQETGIIAYSKSGEIKEINANNINVSTTGKYAGGIAGYTTNTTIKAVNAESINVKTDGNNAGGIAGYNDGVISSVIIKNANVQGDENVGVVIGYNQNNLISAIASGNATANNDIGAITGYGNNINRGVFLGGTLTCSSSCYYGGNVSSDDKTNIILASNTKLNNNNRTYSGNTNNKNGLFVNPRWLNDINVYEQAIDTRIGGDNDNDGYYYDYDQYNNIVIVKTIEKPITQSLLGSGTSDDPYQIYSEQDLYQVSLNPTAHYRLENDINITSTKQYMLGSYENRFQGTFDGNKKTISGFNISGSKYPGLFGYASNATIKDLTIKDFNVNGSLNVGALTGLSGSGTNIKGINTQNINVNGYDSIGIIAGYNNGNITSVVVDGNVAGDEFEKQYMGLIAGYVNNGSIEGIAKGNVNGTNQSGGIVGYKNSSVTVNAVYLEGNVNGSNRMIGGLSGNNVSLLATNKTTLNGSEPTNNNEIDAANGYEIPDTYTDDINTYESAVDTIIGGDNNNDGYYLDYDVNGNIKYIKVEDKPIDFTLQGSGTEEDPYLVNNEAELIQISFNKEAYYKLVNDINLENTHSYMLGSRLNVFNGNLDGNNKTIKGFNIKGSREVGLFGSLAGTVKNLNIEDFNITGVYRIGSIAGYSNNSEIRNVKGKNLTMTGTYNSVGGLIGTTSELKAETEKKQSYNIQLSNINVTGYNNVGGIIGYNDMYNIVNNAIIDGNVTGNNYVGLISGMNLGETILTNIVVSGNVVGVSNVGGLIGRVTGNQNIGSIFKDGSVIATSGNSYRTIGSVGNSLNNTRMIANSNILVNSAKKTSNILGDQNGADVTSEQLLDINTYEMVMDTYIGGDNDGDGQYYDYDINGNIVLTPVQEETPLDGSGTSEDPYLIRNVEDYKKSTKDPSKYYKLEQNINFENTKFYQMGSDQNKFTGTLDGNNKTISNINHKACNNSGIIGYNSGTIKNLNINNYTVDSQKSAGVVTGYNTGTIANINIDTAQITSKSYTGGITGSNTGTIKGITINDLTIAATTNTGGIVGHNTGTINTAIVNADVTGTQYVGIAVGYAEQNSTTKEVVVDGNVYGSSYSAGVVGYNYRATTYGVFRSGSVTGTGSYINRAFGAHNSTTPSIIVKDDITVNAKVPTSNIANVNQSNGLPKTEAELKTQEPYETLLFNFTVTDPTINEYIWYFENEELKFKQN